MANEFKVKNGLIVSGSANISESIYAPGLPPEANPSYYVTWKQSDGELEVSTISPGASSNTIGCWDWVASGDPPSGQFNTNNGAIGSTTTTIFINPLDNNGTNQTSTLTSLGVGSVITLYVGSNATTFEITGISPIYSIGVFQYFGFKVNYISGNEYTPIGTPEMCLGIAAAASLPANCIELQMSNNFNDVPTTAGKSIFLRTVSGISYTSPFGIMDQYFDAFQMNTADLHGNKTNIFFNGLSIGSIITLNYLNYSTAFSITHVGSSASNTLVYAIYISGDFNYTIPTDGVYTICAGR
tara:strand:+ start:1781 stop:2674 length:894 start_codon:yes stop_codon:yes gene_type:complete